MYGVLRKSGILHTAHGTIETPVFMPAGTQATVKGLTQRDLAEDLGVQILLANTYHLFLRPGHELIRLLGGLHRFMSWPNAILVDSGGFQVFSLSGMRKISEHGVEFQSHLNGDLHLFTPSIDLPYKVASHIRGAIEICKSGRPIHSKRAQEATPNHRAFPGNLQSPH